MTADQIRSLRQRLNLSRAEFAARYRISARTVQEWEQGRRLITGPSLVLLTLIERDPNLVASILTPIPLRKLAELPRERP